MFHLSLHSNGNDDQRLEVDADLVIGSDGAYSTIRRELLRRPRYLEVNMSLFYQYYYYSIIIILLLANYSFCFYCCCFLTSCFIHL